MRSDITNNAHAGPRNRGLTLVVALMVVLVISALLIVFARQMQTQAMAANNHIAAVQARMIAEGVAQAILADLAETTSEDAQPNVDLIPVQAGQMGDGLYWIIRPNFDDDTTNDYGIVREAGKINVNTAARDILSVLPGMTDDMAAAVLDWRDQDTEPEDNGAESDYYLTLEKPYNAKNDPFETVEELLMVRDFDRTILYGEDFNRNGVLDDNENNADDTPPADNADGHLDRGLYDFVTVYSRQPAASGDEPPVNLNTAPMSQIAQALRQAVSGERLGQILDHIVAQRPYRSVLDFQLRAELTADEATNLEGRFITQPGQQVTEGLIDATSAPAVVFQALPGMEEGDGEKIVAARSTAASPETNLLWIADAIGPEKAGAIGNYLTTRCYQFSADIVAVAGNGRAFCRLRIVIDISNTNGSGSSGNSGNSGRSSSTGTPRIIFAQDLTALGWPLDPAILQSLRSGKSAADVAIDYGSEGGS